MGGLVHTEKSHANLLQVGCLMIRQVTQVNWRYIGDAIPSFVAMVFIPFSYSVAYGLIAYVVSSKKS